MTGNTSGPGSCARDHDVSMAIADAGVVGRYRGVEPRSKVSMMIMRPPQQGHGGDNVRGSPASAVWVLAG